MLIGLVLPEPFRKLLLLVGVFALSGAITNWLAVYMLFEKIPGLYGSGVIPARFEDFKREIHRLIMEQFFSKDNVERFFGTTGDGQDPALDLAPIIEETDITPAFDALVGVVMASSFGGMLAMAGGARALAPLKQPFTEKMKETFKELAQSPSFQETLRLQLTSASTSSAMLSKVDAMVQQRLAELTPQMVKEIMQQMIRDHLGWLVVWGGLFGGLIGLVTAFLPFF
jgi:uncharacterized membrane protein YheB (UPF0754 family)